MAQSTTNLGKIHVFPSETLYNQFKNLVADNDLALLKDDGAYIIAANLAQNGYVKFSNGLILQWGLMNPMGNNTARTYTFPLAMNTVYAICPVMASGGSGKSEYNSFKVTGYTNSSWSGYASCNESCTAFFIIIGM